MGDELLEKLEKLIQYRDAGVLTAEEFGRAKGRLLGMAPAHDEPAAPASGQSAGAQEIASTPGRAEIPDDTDYDELREFLTDAHEPAEQGVSDEGQLRQRLQTSRKLVAQLVCKRNGLQNQVKAARSAGKKTKGDSKRIEQLSKQLKAAQKQQEKEQSQLQQLEHKRTQEAREEEKRRAEAERQDELARQEKLERAKLEEAERKRRAKARLAEQYASDEDSKAKSQAEEERHAVVTWAAWRPWRT
eukprot:COSAG04_NODE_1121_length_8162_cov_9.527595_3_plen_245_part_00